MNRSHPEKVFRIGYVSASVFARKIEKDGEPDRIVRSVNLQKRYLDNGETKFSSSFGLGELPQAIEAMRLAFDHLAEQEADVASLQPNLGSRGAS
jgi:hypothetical protein